MSAARTAQNMSMREFGAALGVSQQMISYWEAGTSAPDMARIARWIDDDRDWVQVLALRMFYAMRPGLVRAIMLPNEVAA